ncbi:MAG TPA: cytochrome c-type biogenesis protein CcmH [Candidatus Binatia bacterium]
MEEETRAIAAELRCPVCQNLSVADSPSELAQQMRALIQEQLQAGKSPQEVKQYFVSKYGDWVLLAPPARGFSLLLWILPGIVALLGLALAVFFIRRWMKKKDAPAELDAALALTGQRGAAGTGGGEGAESPRAFLRGEQARLEAEIKELEFDFHAGKLSQSDYDATRGDLESQSAAVLKRLGSLPAEPRRPSARSQPAAAVRKGPAAGARPVKRWPFAAGGVFLLLFGLALGVLLTKSLRPRASERDTITGDFLTGTPPGGGDAVLAQGRMAFERGDWAKAIDAFKKVLQADPNQPEAHAYMGMILAQAGHTEGALMAFDKALAVEPNFPMALWGKGMLLYQTNGDLGEARRLLQKVSSMMPPGPEKQEVEKTIAQLARDGNAKSPPPPQSSPASAQPAPPAAQPAVAGAQVEGTVDIDAKLKGKIDGQAVLFVIARSTAGAAGPPLAVKKIAHPKFPVNFSLDSQDVMMPGAVLSGKVFIFARLDKDGNPTTREPGNVAGEYKKNPVEVGAKKIDIILDQVQ